MNKKKIRAEDLTEDEKISLLSGNEVWHTAEIKRLGIKPLTLRDGPHGVRDGTEAVSFPNLCLVACGWDRSLVYRMGEMLGEEARKHGADVLLAPGVNLKRTPTGGRNFEYFSEDPFLTGELAAEFVKGVQSRGVAACVKHYVCNDRENGRFSCNVNVDEKTLREVYVKPFETVVKKADPECVMSAYNLVNGEFAANSETLGRILRKDLGFRGVVLSDWGGTDGRALFYRAYGDLEMPGSDGKTHEDVKKTIRLGELSPEKLNESADRVLGLIGFCSEGKKIPLSSDGGRFPEDLARIAAESMVLLKNDGILPLKKSVKAAILGDAASEAVFCGGGCAFVGGSGSRSVAEELTEVFPDARYIERPGKELSSFDVVIVFLKEGESSEGFDRENISVDCGVLKKAYRYNKNVIAVLVNGAVLSLGEVKRNSAAIVETYYAGQAEGRALAMLLSGETNPCGRLAETFVKKLSDCYAAGEEKDEEIFYREGTSVGYRYYGRKGVAPEYPFGFGLSYTEFTCSGFTADKTELTEKDDGVMLSVTVKNNGLYDGKEVLQVYLNGDGRNGDPSLKLVAFDKIFLKRGEEKRVGLFVPLGELKSYSPKEGKFVLRRGRVRLSLNKDATKEIFSAEIRLVPAMKVDRHLTVGELIGTPHGAKIAEKYLKKAIVGCIVGDDENYPFSIVNGHIEGDLFFSRVAESLELRQMVSMSNNRFSEEDLGEVIKAIDRTETEE